MNIEKDATGLVIIPVLMAVMRAVKASPIPDWTIPWVAMVLGTLANGAVYGWTGMNLLGGLLLGASVVGLHQSLKQPFEAFAKDRQPGGSLPGGGGENSSRFLGGARVLVFGLVLFSTMFGSGCATTGGGGGSVPPASRDAAVDQARRTAAVVETSAQLGTYFAVRKDPNARAYFETAVIVVDALIKDGAHDPEKLRSALDNISVKELKSDEARAGIEAALTLYQAYFGERVSDQVGGNPMASEVLKALSSGIGKGLLTTPTEKKYGIKRQGVS